MPYDVLDLVIKIDGGSPMGALILGISVAVIFVVVIAFVMKRK